MKGERKEGERGKDREECINTYLHEREREGERESSSPKKKKQVVQTAGVKGLFSLILAV
jgi:hypothetical protein